MAKYIIRLDDSCPTAHKNNWYRIEKILDEFAIKPIVAVIPDNKDASLFYEPEDTKFWKKVKNWQNKGWSIALHGYQHSFHKVKRHNMIFPFYNRSEFGELSLKTQRDKIKIAYQMFKSQNIFPEVWVAPAHSFDDITLEALKTETEINIVSDGISFYPFHRNRLLFVPQQLWAFKRKYLGVWTICLHPNTMQEQDFSNLEKNLNKYHQDFIGIHDALLLPKSTIIVRKIFSSWFWLKYEIKHLIGKMS